MGRAAENLDRECRLNAASALFQKANVLLFRFANAAESGAETHPDAMVWFIVRIFNSRVVERELGRRDGKLRVTIKSFQSMGRKKLFRIPILDLSGHAHTETAGVEIVDPTNA